MSREDPADSRWPGVRLRQDGRYIAFWCQGCGEAHGWLPVHPGGEHAWHWDESTGILTPSVRHYTSTGDRNTPEYRETTTCHYNVGSGKITYHADSSNHNLRGVVDMVDPPAGKGAGFGWFRPRK